MITLSNNTNGLALLHKVVEIYGKVYTSDSLLQKVLFWLLNCSDSDGDNVGYGVVCGNSLGVMVVIQGNGAVDVMVMFCIARIFQLPADAREEMMVEVI